MRKREQLLLREHEELRKAGLMNEDFFEANRKLVSASAKFDDIKKHLKLEF